MGGSSQEGYCLPHGRHGANRQRECSPQGTGEMMLHIKTSEVAFKVSWTLIPTLAELHRRRRLMQEG